MDKQLILFDFDKTLFDVKTFFEKQLFPALEKEFQISQKTLDNISKEYRESLTKSTQFDPEGWIKTAKKHFDFDADHFREFLQNPTFFKEAIFPEVVPTLTELSHDYVLGIYSEANFEWQMKKITLSGLINYFDQSFISISADKVSDQVIDLIPQRAIVVDDKLEVIAALKRREDLFPIWLNRLGLQGLPSVREIRDLSQLLRVVEQIRGASQQLS